VVGTCDGSEVAIIVGITITSSRKKNE
jgi:hypothetical protein